MKYKKINMSRWDEIVSIEPYYRSDERTGSVIHYQDGSWEDVYCRCEKVVAELARYFGTTVEQAQQRAQRLLGEENTRKLPIMLHELMCLVPLKFREERTHNTGTLGYVVLIWLQAVQEQVDGVRLRYYNNAIYTDIPQRLYTVQRHLKRARMLEKRFCMEEEERREKCRQHARRQDIVKWPATRPVSTLTEPVGRPWDGANLPASSRNRWKDEDLPPDGTQKWREEKALMIEQANREAEERERLKQQERQQKRKEQEKAQAKEKEKQKEEAKKPEQLNLEW